MRILAFDTATRATTVALVNTDDATATERRDDPPRGQRPQHTTQLMALIVEVLGSSQSNWSEVDLIAVGVGPGTFTGLRIGVATARALAQAREVALVGVSTLRSLARGAAGAAGRPGADGTAPDAVMAVLDARRSEVFASGWPLAGPVGAASDALLQPRALSPEALAEAMRWPARRWLAVGDGAIEFRSVLERSGARIPEDDSPLHRVSAIEHCRLATELHVGPADSVRPEYLRLPDAELSRRAPSER